MLTPQELELPAKFKGWKGQQEEVIEKVVNADKKLYLLDAPTGSGKSVIGVAASYIWRTNWLTTRTLEGEDVDCRLPKRVIYVTRTKQLQQQLLDDFPGARMIKGRDNFPCLLAPERFSATGDQKMTAEDCPHTGKDTHCPFKSSCPYLVAKAEALNAEIAVLNDSYYLAETNGPGQFSGADFVILDEVDCIESTLMGQITLPISIELLEQFKLEPPNEPGDWKSWVYWWNTSMSTREITVSQAENSQPTLDVNQWSATEIKVSRRIKRLANFNNSLNVFMQETVEHLLAGAGATRFQDAMKITLSGKETPFVVSEYAHSKTKKFLGWHLKPVTVRNFASRRLWRHSQRFLGMSGTILSPVVLARELGLLEHQYDYRQIPSPFSVKNRPVYYWPVANMRKKNIDDGTAVPKMLAAVDQLLTKYAGQKVLIHTTSYPLASAIRHDQVDLKDNDRIIWHDPEDRLDQLEAFKKSARPLVMVSPSFDRGVDLPDNLCRCIIIVKVPYLYLGDKQVEARLKAPGGDQWYVFKALQTLLQMSGRGVRNENDWCDTYILDAQFTGLLTRTRQYIPQWWMDAIRRIEGI
jgi:ATP-dependent DNA helicase DinG